jgi:hypothetical protein
MSRANQADYGKYFPPLSQAVGDGVYKNLTDLKKLGPPFPSSINGLLGQIGLETHLGYGKMIKNYLESVLGEPEFGDMGMAMDLLEEKLNPKKIVGDRLYPISRIIEIIKVCFNSKKLAKMLKEKGEIEIYQMASRYYIPGKDIPRVKEFIKRIRSQKPGKHKYAPVGDEPFTYVTDIMQEISILPHQLSTILEENAELREMIYVDIRGKRVVRTAEKEELKEKVKKTEEYKSYMQKNAIPQPA